MAWKMHPPHGAFSFLETDPECQVAEVIKNKTELAIDFSIKIVAFFPTNSTGVPTVS